MASLEIFLFLILILPALSSSETSKLIVFAGIPSSLDGGKTSEISWDACLGQCWYDPDCRVVFQSTSSCYAFKLENITIQASTDEVNRVAVKLDVGLLDPLGILTIPGTRFRVSRTALGPIPNDPTCLPKSSDFFNQTFTETNNKSQIIRSEFSYSNGQYRVVYTVSICPNTTDLYTRTVDSKTYHVCVGFRLFEGRVGAFYDAQKLCEEDGGYGLSGPLDVSEYAIFKDKGLALRKVDGQDKGGYFWIDGFSNQTKYVFLYEDESHNGATGYPMHPAQQYKNPPTGYFMLFPGKEDVMGDYEAEKSWFVNYYFIGALCRVNDVPEDSN
ncbi:unnamed protein product [Caenorhabditis nigoni]